MVSLFTERKRRTASLSFETQLSVFEIERSWTMQKQRAARFDQLLSPTFLALISAAMFCQSAMAAETYIIRENLHPGDKAQDAMTYVCKTKSTSTTNGNAIVTDTETRHEWKLALTVQDGRDGSSINTLAQLDPESVDLEKDAGGPEQKTTCPFVGKAIILTRHPDGSLANSFQGSASDEDVSLLNNFVTPDAEYYPDKPVAVGDTWDDSAKVAKFAPLGPGDQVTSQGRLDWVKIIGGKQIAQITNAGTVTYHEDGNVQEIEEMTITSLVDIASGITIKCDEKGSSKRTTPPTEATQVTGGMEFVFRAEVQPNPPAGK